MTLKADLLVAIQTYFTKHNNHLPTGFWSRSQGARNLSIMEKLLFGTGCKGAEVAIGFYNWVDGQDDETTIKNQMIEALCTEGGALSKFVSRSSTHLRAAVLTALLRNSPSYSAKQFRDDIGERIREVEIASKRRLSSIGPAGAYGAGIVERELKVVEKAKAMAMSDLLKEHVLKTPNPTPAAAP